MNSMDVPYFCHHNNCGKTFEKASDLTKHLETHANRPFICEWQNCDKKYKLRHHLERHVRVHTGVTPYVCQFPNCDRKFRRKDGLKFHVLCSHTKERPYSCEWPNCGKKCISKSNLNSHMQRHIGEVKYACNICDIRWKSKKSLVNHNKKVHTKLDNKS